MHNSKKISHISGFTLTELSIVVIIIGFIVGAFTYGRDLIRQSSLTSIIRDYNNYKSAIENFKYKYNEIPGDFSVATSYWTACTDSGANTCNGNGNGIITDTGNENGRAWQHLSLSKFIDESYTGAAIDNTVIAGVDYPLSEIKDSGYDLISYTNDQETFDIVLTLAKTNGQGIEGATLSAIDAWGIDNKTDDGIALSGHVFVSTELDAMDAPLTTTCLDTASPAQYDLDDESVESICLLHMAIKI